MNGIDWAITLGALAIVAWVIRLAWDDGAEQEKKDRMRPWRPGDRDEEDMSD